MHPAFALFAPNHQIDHPKGQTRARIYRPDNSDPIHRIMATNSEAWFVSRVLDSTEDHSRIGDPVTTATVVAKEVRLEGEVLHPESIRRAREFLSITPVAAVTGPCHRTLPTRIGASIFTDVECAHAFCSVHAP